MAYQGDLERARAYYRQQLMRKVLYTPAREHAAASGDPQERWAGANFMAGRDMPSTATHFRDMATPAYGTLSLLGNAMALLAGLKSHRTVDTKLRFDVTMSIETLLSVPRPADGYRQVVGIRVGWGVDPLQSSVRVAANNAAAAAPAPAPHPPPPPASPVPAGRRRRASNGGEAEHSTDEEPGGNGGTGAASASELIKTGPVGRAINASIRESKPIITELQRFLSSPAGRSAAGQGETPARMLAKNMVYRYALATVPENAFYDMIQPYLLVSGSAPATDPRSWSRLVDGAAVDGLNRYSLANPAHPLHPDSIFSKETTMFYKRIPNAEPLQWRLSSYVPNVATADEQTLDTLLQPLANGGCGPVYGDCAHPMYPFPGVVHRVNDHARLVEVLLPHMPFPYPMGTWLAPDVVETEDGSPVHLDLSEAYHERLLAAVDELAASEAREARAAAMDPARGPVTIRQQGRNFGTTVRPVDMTETLDTVEERLARSIADGDLDNQDVNGTAAAAGLLNAERRAALQQDQERACAAALRHLGTHYQQKTAYRELANASGSGPAVLATVSTHLELSLTDLMPLGLVAGGGDVLHQLLHQRPSNATRELRERLNELMSANDANAASAEARSAIAQRVDIFADWQLARNGFLVFRQRKQLERAGQDYFYKTARAKLLNTQADEIVAGQLTPSDADEQLREFEAVWQKKREEFSEQVCAEFDKLYRTTSLASKSLIEARDYALKHYMKPGQTGTMVDALIDARPFVSVMQYVTDVFVQVEQVSYQNLPYLQRVWICLFQAHRWKPRRSQPAMNYVVAGTSGTGKSFVITRAEFLTPPGIVQNLTTSTTASMNVDEDFDNQAMVQEEVDTGILFTQQAGGKDLGATDKANFAKARMTSFQTVTQYFYYDEEAKQRMPRKCYSSQHLVFIGGTNQDLTNMDTSVGRRLLIDYVAEVVQSSDGGKASDMDEFELFKQTDAAPRAQHMLRELHCAVMYYETGIKAGAWPDVLEDGGRLVLNNALAHASTKSVPTDKTTKKHWVMEAARVLAIIEACFSALFLPAAHLLYQTSGKTAQALQDDNPRLYARLSSIEGALAAAAAGQPMERWSWRMFQKLVVPMAHVTKEHVLFALSAFDFLYAPRSEEQLIHTMATKVCNMTEPARWHFRVESYLADASRTPVYDYNYFAIRGKSDTKIHEYLADQNKHNTLLRPMDVAAMLHAYTRQHRDVPPVRIRTEPTEGGGTRHSFYLDNKATTIPQPAIIYEYEPSSNGNIKNSVRQLCVSIEFLCRRFGMSVDTPIDEMARRLSRHERTLPGDRFGHLPHQLRDTTPPNPDGLRLAAEIGVCHDERSPLIQSMRAVLSNRTLELSPYELPGTEDPERTRRYMTFYTPDQPLLTFPPRTPGDPDVTKRVPMHGAHLMLQLERRTDGELLRRDNYTLPLPTARQNIYQTRSPTPAGQSSDGGDNAPIGIGANSIGEMENSRGFQVRKYDVDFEMAAAQQRQVGDTGLRLFERLYVHGVARLLGKDMEDVEAALERQAPAMTREQPLPWTFRPLLMRIEQTALWLLCPDRVPIANYPAINIYARLAATAERYRSQIDGTMSAYDDYGAAIDPYRNAVVMRNQLVDAARKRSRDTTDHDALAEIGADRGRARARRIPITTTTATAETDRLDALFADSNNPDPMPMDAMEF